MNSTSPMTTEWYWDWNWDWDWDWQINTTLANLTEPVTGQWLAVLYITGAALGLVINTILVCAIVLGSHTSKQVHIPLINLAVADTFYGVFVCVDIVVTQDSFMYYSFPNSQLFCTFFIHLWSSMLYISLLWGLEISIERFVITYFPMKLRYYTRTKKIIVAVAVWTLSFLIAIYNVTNAALVNVLYYGPAVEPFTRTQCFQLVAVPDWQYFTVIILLVPPTIMIVMYILIICKLCCKKQIGETAQPNEFKRHIQMTMMLAVDAFFNLISSGLIVAPVTNSLREDLYIEYSGSFNFDDVIYAISLVNCFITPVFYYIFNQSIRGDVHDLCRRICRREPRPIAGRRVRVQTNRTNQDGETSPLPTVEESTV